MSLLINGMSIPNDDYKHRHLTLDRSTDDGALRMSFLTFDSETWIYSCSVYRVSEIPTPHGRLIDADAIMDLLEKSEPEENRGLQFYVIRHMLRNAPTVIEAEG